MSETGQWGHSCAPVIWKQAREGILSISSPSVDWHHTLLFLDPHMAYCLLVYSLSGLTFFRNKNLSFCYGACLRRLELSSGFLESEEKVESVYRISSQSHASGGRHLGMKNQKLLSPIGWRSQGQSPLLLSGTVMPEQEFRATVYPAAATTDVSSKRRRRHALSPHPLPISCSPPVGRIFPLFLRAFQYLITNAPYQSPCV